MIEKDFLHLSREKHLDHLVRVVPVIVLCYAFQCYAIMSLQHVSMAGTYLTISGCCLALLIFIFVHYDLKHQVIFYQDRLEIDFYLTQVIQFKDIQMVVVIDSEATFSSLIIYHSKGKSKFYFTDTPETLKTWIDKHREQKSLAA